jgi:small GTP-binding protein
MLVDITSKIVLIGDTAVGKTSILKKYVHNENTDTHLMTIGVDYLTKLITTIHNNKSYNIRLQLWDTAGLERFRSITKIYYTGTSYVIIVFDMSNIESFHNATNLWLNDVNKSLQNSTIILVGNKYDKCSYETEILLEKWLKNNNHIIFFKTSLKDYQSINNIFNTILNDIIIRLNNKDLLNGTTIKNNDYIILNQPITYKKKNKCLYWC